mmetsp:Transcript_108089/g.207754  ORF Transcript_108089/g.207754 Transcript_108089/m.207754 type:complete len:243 (+) Transcript_108089:36-764(+)
MGACSSCTDVSSTSQNLNKPNAFDRRPDHLSILSDDPTCKLGDGALDTSQISQQGYPESQAACNTLPVGWCKRCGRHWCTHVLGESAHSHTVPQLSWDSTSSAKQSHERYGCALPPAGSPQPSDKPLGHWVEMIQDLAQAIDGDRNMPRDSLTALLRGRRHSFVKSVHADEEAGPSLHKQPNDAYRLPYQKEGDLPCLHLALCENRRKAESLLAQGFSEAELKAHSTESCPLQMYASFHTGR